jgi:AraC-like DNA-binding protein
VARRCFLLAGKRAVCQAIEAELDDCELSLQSFADEQYASPRYIRKLFGEAGFSFSQYLR